MINATTARKNVEVYKAAEASSAHMELIKERIENWLDEQIEKMSNIGGTQIRIDGHDIKEIATYDLSFKETPYYYTLHDWLALAIDIAIDYGYKYKVNANKYTGSIMW